MARILHVDTEPTWRGGERQLFWLAEELERRGHKNWVACRPGSPLEDACRRAGLDTVDAAPWGEADMGTAARLRRLIREKAIGIVHAHTGHAVGLGALAAWRTAAKLVATRRVDFPLRRNLLSRWKYRRMDALVAISSRVKEVMAAGGVDSAKVAVIPSGINVTGYPSVSDRDRLRSARGYAPGSPIVVNVGALVPHKDQATLVRAAPAVCRVLPDARFLILGDGPLRDSLTDLARALGVETRVRFLGHRADVLDFVAMADVFVLCSTEEGLGTSLLDAMALGVPTVATRAGGIPEIYGNSGAPDLAPPGDPEALARAVLKVLQSPEEAGRRSRHGQERAAEFTVKKMADRYEALYRGLAVPETNE